MVDGSEDRWCSMVRAPLSGAGGSVIAGVACRWHQVQCCDLTLSHLQHAHGLTTFNKICSFGYNLKDFLKRDC